jgi:hypothetical protein
VSEGARIEEIKYTLKHEEGNHRYAYEEDVSYLIKRVEELEEENKGVSISETHHATLLADCEMENQRLRKQLEKTKEQITEIQRGTPW